MLALVYTVVGNHHILNVYFALISTEFHSLTEYADLDAAHMDPVQLLNKWLIWGLIPQFWCYKYHALIS